MARKLNKDVKPFCCWFVLCIIGILSVISYQSVPKTGRIFEFPVTSNNSASMLASPVRSGILLSLNCVTGDAVIKCRVTAYCPCWECCGKWSDGKFADGTPISRRVAAAPRNIPFGTKIDIPRYGLATVRDRGGAIYDNGIDLPRLDVFFFTHQEALEWGVQYLECQVQQTADNRPQIANGGVL